MDRSRRMPQRRRPLGASASPTSTSEASFDFNPITSPVVAQTNTTPGGRRSTKPLQHAFTFSPPSSSRNSNPKRRSTTMDNFPMQDEGEHGPKKGGHSLRKRARVDYTFEHIDDDVVVPNSTSSARGKKRRSEINFDTDDFYNNDSKRRGASMGADTPSSRRRNPTRKSSDLKAFHQAALQDDDNEVQDTIEVGAYYSDVDDSELRDGADSNNSSPQSKMSPKTSPQKSPQNESTKNELPAPQFHNGFQIGPSTENAASSSGVNQVLSEKPYPAVEHISNSIEELVSQPAEPQAENFPNAEPEPATYNYQQPSTTLEADYPLTPLETAVPSTKPEPAASATALTVPDISIKAEEAEPAAVSVSAPELAPTIAQLPITADENNQSESIHSPIVPASQLEPADIISELPPAEPTSQLNPAPESLTSSTTTIIEEKEEPHQPIVEQVEQEQIPEPPTQLPDQHQEDKMDKMDIDPLLEENVPQDIEMTDAAAIDTTAAQDKVSTPSPEPTSTSALGPADLPSPLPSNTIPSSPPKSPAKLRSPSPAQEDEQLPQETIIPSPNADTDEIRMSVELSNDHQTETENVNKEVVEENNENKEPEPVEVPVTADEPQVPDSPQNHITQEEPAIVSSPLEPKAPTPPPAETIETPASSAPSETKPSPQKPVAPRVPLEFMPQPTPVGRWSHLKPYVEGEFTMYPEKKGNEDGNDDVTPEGKDADRDADMEPMVDDQDDAGLEAPTPALNTPTRGSPVPDSADPTALNSPAPAGEDGDEADESQELSERTRYYKYRKLRDPEEYVSVLENYEDMSTEELYELLEAVNVSMVQWQDEWTEQGAIVDDYENSLRRRAADSKYEARTRNLHQHGINYEEPEFAVKGYKSREKEGLTETRYLQGQDRIMAATYGFEYDPHPSKIGKQNPETQQVGVMTRGRSLRNQPRQTAKATEGEEVVGKRQRKPVQLFDPTTQDVSRSSTPVPATRATGRRRKNANAEDEPQSNLAVSFTSEVVSDGEGPKTRRKRGTRSKNAVQEEEAVPTPDTEEVVQESPQKPTRRGRARPAVKYEEADPNEFVDEEPQEEEEEVMEEPEENEKEKEEKPTVRRHLVTLKLPSGYFEATPEMEIVDNGDSRPTTACSEESSQTVESSYSFRPKRQKRFRDDPDETEESAQAPPKKRGKRTSGGTTVADVPSTASTPVPSTESAQPINSRKIQKIKVVRSGQDTKNGGTPQATPAPPPPPPPPAPATPTPTPGPVDDNDDTPKDYKSMTKSEKMSASMKNRWANGNMAGAVEKRKATLAAKKAAQAAAEQRTGVVAPKPKGKTPMKRDSTLKMQMAPEQPQMPLQQQPPPPPHMMHQQPPPMHPHQHQHHPHQYPVHHQHPQHHHQHPPPPPPHPAHMQQMHHPQHMPPHPPPPPPPHQPGNPPPPFMHGHGQHPNHGHSHGMPGMGYHY